MAYAITNPVKKVAQMGDTNSLWYYTDGDAIGTIVAADYFILSYLELKAGDVILVNSGGSNGVIDTVIVSLNDGGSNLDTIIEA
tara:strand:- start:103 stop:354 length:252 start_codon:yes stop_codon:yes gene_type:complete